MNHESRVLDQRIAGLPGEETSYTDALDFINGMITVALTSDCSALPQMIRS